MRLGQPASCLTRKGFVIPRTAAGVGAAAGSGAFFPRASKRGKSGSCSVKKGPGRAGGCGREVPKGHPEGQPLGASVKSVMVGCNADARDPVLQMEHVPAD